MLLYMGLSLNPGYQVRGGQLAPVCRGVEGRRGWRSLSGGSGLILARVGVAVPDEEFQYQL